MVPEPPGSNIFKFVSFNVGVGPDQTLLNVDHGWNEVWARESFHPSAEITKIQVLYTRTRNKVISSNIFDHRWDVKVPRLHSKKICGIAKSLPVMDIRNRMFWKDVLIEQVGAANIVEVMKVVNAETLPKTVTVDTGKEWNDVDRKYYEK